MNRPALTPLAILGLAAALPLGAQTASGERASTAAPAPATNAPPADSPGQSLIDQQDEALAGRAYTYDAAGRRDPFRSLLVRSEARNRGARPSGIAGIAVDDVTVQGIWKTRSGMVAQVRGTDNKSYLLRPGDLLFDGEVTRVSRNEVGFRQNLNDPQSVKPFRDVTKQLNATIKP